MLASEYITPIEGVPYFRSVGIIKAVDKNKNRYNVAEVSFERYDDQNFQYVFSPYWKLIEFLPRDVFDGIPGIDMDVRKEHYYRVNMTPSFISKRTPSRTRENVKELLDEVGLDYYDRFEWLLRTDRHCGDDNLVVERKRNEESVFETIDAETINSVQPGDKIILNRLCDIAPNRKMLSESLFRLLQSGATISIKEDNITFSAELSPNPLYILERMMEYSRAYDAIRRKEGIEQAKSEEKYKGRKRMEVDALVFEDIADKFEKRIIIETQALDKLGMSRSTFYRRMREYKRRIEEDK
jgi:hypothetical protein